MRPPSVICRASFFLLVLVSRAAPAQRAEVNPAYMDTKYPACTDFYSYANGTWQQNVVISPRQRSVGASQESSDRAGIVLNDILKNAAASYRSTRDVATRKLGTFYTSCMDSARADRDGIAPIRPQLDLIDRVATPKDLSRALGKLHLLWVDAGFGTITSFASGQGRVWAYADMKNAARNILWISQGGMGLPEPGYYTRRDSASAALRIAYRDHIARTLNIGGSSTADAERDAADIIDIETKLAEASLKPVEQFEPAMIYQPTTVGALAKLAPAIDWPVYFREIGIAGEMKPGTTISASPGKFFRALSDQISERPIPTWRAYLRWQLLRATSAYLGATASSEDFKLVTLLTGTTQPPSRAGWCTSQADALMGMAIGEIYVKKAFPAAAKKRVEELVANVRAVLRQRVEQNDWMTPATKTEALRKVDVVRVEVGYPASWVSYATVPLSTSRAFVDNVLSIRTFLDRRHLSKLRIPVDRGEWEMSPATVNAYENPQFNALFFPAAILQAPRFSLDADDAVNYGALGRVIGHELTHFFDDQGRQFDARGNLRDWWTAEDARRYQERADVVRRQYDAYVAIDTLHVNGRLTLNENIADIGGLTIAYNAFQRAMAGKPLAADANGSTPNQEFFLGMAQSIRFKTRPQEVRRRVFVDGHAPPYWRTNGPVSALSEFAAAFSCHAGDPMVGREALKGRLW
ncbi:MAG: M13 family metallopeptidase [Gemmatimonadaceae bacterium]|nr:M13 family metallopeptidase [Gemmatimonadaceae bacterium]